MKKAKIKSNPAKSKTTILQICYCGIFIAIITVFSWITINTSAVQFTLQTMGIFMVLATLGGKLGTLTTLAYLLLGAIGVPVFSGFSGGIGHLLNQTGGYLFGFLLITLIYWLFEKIPGDKLWVKIIAMLLGLFACYAAGTAWFMYVYAKTRGPVTIVSALSWCVFPFIIPDIAKMILALFISSKLKKIIKKSQKNF